MLRARQLSLPAFFYFLCLLANDWHAYHHPEYNWDMLPYMAVVKNYEHPYAAIRDTVYATARREIPPELFRQLADSSSPYRRRALRDSLFFGAQLEFYQVKPLYTGLSFLFYRAGCKLTRATVLPSLVAYLLLGLLVLFWLALYLKPWHAVMAGLFLMFSAPLMQAARLSTPDAMAAFFVLVSFFALTERRSLWMSYLALILAILTRIDNLLPCVFLFSVVLFSQNGANRLSRLQYVLMMAGALAAFLLAPVLFSGNILRPAAFFEHLKPSGDLSAGFGWANYVELVKAQFMAGLYYSSLPLFLFVSVLLLVPGRLRQADPDRLLVLVMLLVIAARFILQPVVSDRFYIPYYLCIAILLAKRVAREIYP